MTSRILAGTNDRHLLQAIGLLKTFFRQYNKTAVNINEIKAKLLSLLTCLKSRANQI